MTKKYTEVKANRKTNITQVQLQKQTIILIKIDQG